MNITSTTTTPHPDLDTNDAGSTPTYVAMALMVVCGLLAVVTNSLVIIAGINKKMFEVIVMSLAAVDLLTGLICCPYMATVCYYNYFGSTHHDIYVNNYIYTLPNIFQVCTVWHVLYMTTIRLLNISPYRSLAKILPNRKRKFEPLFVVLIWAGSILVSIMYQLFGSPDCSVGFHFPFILWIFIVVPVLITILLHIVIFCFANNISRRRITKEDEKKLLQNVKAAKTTFLVVVALVVCYTPITVKWQGCYNSFVFRLTAYAMVMINSFINPIIYVLKISAFRKAVFNYVRIKDDVSDVSN